MARTWESTVELLKWLRDTKPSEIYAEAKECSNTDAAFNMCEHLITEVDREKPLNIHARILKARLFLQIGAKSHAINELKTAMMWVARAGLDEQADAEIASGRQLLDELNPPLPPWIPPPKPSDLASVLAAIQALCDGLNPPCTEEQLQQLRSLFDGNLPSEIEQLYRDHNGSRNLPGIRDQELSLAAAMIPVEEFAELQEYVAEALRNEDIELSERIAWIWFDGAGNYAGVFLDGPDRGKVTKFFHEFPEIRPAYLSVYDFMATLLLCGYIPEREDIERPCDIWMLPENPTLEPASEPAQPLR